MRLFVSTAKALWIWRINTLYFLFMRVKDMLVLLRLA